jgi:hypothetical protein
MRDPERVEDYLEHIARTIQRAAEDAVIGNLRIIGEAARQTPLLTTAAAAWRRSGRA